MKKILLLLLFFILLAFGVYRFSLIHRSPDSGLAFKVLLVYHPRLIRKYGYIRKAYNSVLKEEGIPFEWVTPSYILAHKQEEIIKSSPAIILPDNIAQILPPDMTLWIKEFLQKGGNVAFIYDPGTMNREIAFLDKSIFHKLLGFNYATYNTLGEKSYTTGSLQFKNTETAEFFQIPPGKLTKDLWLCGYQYGKLKYPVSRFEVTRPIKEKNIYARAYVEGGKEYSCIVLEDSGRGKILYVNLPLGYLKAVASDDLLLRETLRTFLFKVVKIPHLLNTYYGKGGIVFNWHLDDYRERENTLFMVENGYFKKGREYSIHITAGPFNDHPGDGLGFDAGNKGKKIVKLLLNYGTIGSHGGWGHNWFAENIESGRFGTKEIEEYIKKNTECLENTTGYKVVEYSAPNGVFPQPENTEILEKFGFNSYYFTGDSGSGPNRTFAKGKMVSKNVIAFPVMSFIDVASFNEMGRKKISPEEFQKWLFAVLNYTVKNKTVRLLYSHLYDLLDYPQYLHPFKIFLNQIDKDEKEGKVQMKPMSYFAKFLLRFLKTEYSFKLQKNGLKVTLKNPEGLKGITFAIPKKQYQEAKITDSLIEKEDENYYYVICTKDVNEKTFYFEHR